ncbi:unnamed protein product [Ectocarpus sp. CCAP 1310/34]|nr:unnamed protein product [Ectocarpus sp. CCAP 1310/34]
MPVTFGPPGGGAAGAAPVAPSAGSGNTKAHPPGVKEILKTVTPNYVVTAVIKNRLEEGKIKAQKKKRRTRQEILAGMDLRELQMERLAMARMGFLDKAREVEVWIESERLKTQKEREEKEQAILAQKLGGLDISHRRRFIGLENKQGEGEAQFRAKCEKEKEELRLKHKREYDMLIEETAQRAYGGVSSCQCEKTYLCRHNKTASYNTRKPTREVIRLRQNAERLRATGRVEEAEEFEIQAQDLDDACDKQWRTRVEQRAKPYACSFLHRTSLWRTSAWSGGKSRLEQLVEKQQHTVKSLEETHEAKYELLVKQQDIQRRNLKSTFEAERKKVAMYCRRAALKRMTRDIKEDADEERRTMANKSDGMDNVFLGNARQGAIHTSIRELLVYLSAEGREHDELASAPPSCEPESSSDDSSLDSAARKKKNELKQAAANWVAPTSTGVNNSEAIVKYDDLKTGKIYSEMEEMKARGVGVDHAVDDYEAVKEKLGADVDTSGSRFNDAFRIARAENQRQDMILISTMKKGSEGLTGEAAPVAPWTPPTAPGVGSSPSPSKAQPPVDDDDEEKEEDEEEEDEEDEEDEEGDY